MLLSELARAFKLHSPDWLVAGASFRYDRILVKSGRRGRKRVVYVPDPLLMAVQRWINRRVLSGLPVHSAAAAYSKGSSPARNARAHSESRFLLRMDFSSFFESIRIGDLRRHLMAFRKSLPRDWASEDDDTLLALVCRKGALVMGAPTSPLLSNSICCELDLQLEDLAETYGACYTRYADDMFFSSNQPSMLSSVERGVREVVYELRVPKNLRLNEWKTRHTSKRQRRRVTGVVLTPQGQLSVGRQRKREIRSLIHRFDDLSKEDRRRLSGLLAWARDVEPELIPRLTKKYGDETMRKVIHGQADPPVLTIERSPAPVTDTSGTAAPDPDGFQEPWMERVSRLLTGRRFSAALRVIESVIEDEMPLFWGTPTIDRSRRIAWLYRIHLLRQMNRRSAALAWTCLECEINPDNASARLLKDQLKEELQLGKDQLASVPNSTAVEWQGVAGMGPLKATLERDVVGPLRDPALHERYGLRPPNGIVFHGPPGCGKTHLARALGKAIGYGCREVKPSDLASIYVHGSQQLIAQSFKQAEANSPAVLFFDELDALIPSRAESGLHHGYKEAVNEFLVQLDKCSERGILVVGATNRLGAIDSAALRAGRLEHHFFIGPPDFEGREAAMRLHMKSRVQEKDIDWLNLAAVSEGLSFADIELAVNQAARRALAEGRAIGTTHLLSATEELRVRGSEN